MQGVEALFNDAFPIESHDKSMALEFHGYSLGRPRYQPGECRELKYTYAYPLRVRVGLRIGEESIEEDIYLGEVPVMMGGGEFIINGSERVIVAQLHRSPGIDFSVELHSGDKKLHSARLIPVRGGLLAEAAIPLRHRLPPHLRQELVQRAALLVHQVVHRGVALCRGILLGLVELLPDIVCRLPLEKKKSYAVFCFKKKKHK